MPIEKLINLSLETGVFPDDLKLAKVIPIFKKGDLLQWNNYIAISLISNISKIIKKHVHQRLYIFLENNIIYFIINNLASKMNILRPMP